MDHVVVAQKRNLKMLTLAFLATMSGSLRAQEGVNVPETKQSKEQQSAVNLRVVQAGEFCRRVTNAMTSLGGQAGLDRRAAVRIGGKAAAAIIAQLKGGSMQPYMDTETFKASAVAATGRTWFSLPEVLVSSLGAIPSRVLMVENINDLKLTPQVMPGSQLLVLASTTGDMTPERAKQTAQTAQALGVQINIIWVNPSREIKDIRGAQGLAFMASLTGGTFLDLGAEGACGQT